MRSVIAFLALSGLAIAAKVNTHRHTGIAHHHHGENSHAHRHAVARRHRHGEAVHRPVRKSLLRFPLRKVAARRRVVSGESTVRKTAALFKIPAWLSRRAPHHHHGEHAHAHHAHGEHVHHHHGRPLLKKVKSVLGLFKLPSWLSRRRVHRHGEHTHHRHGEQVNRRLVKKVAKLALFKKSVRVANKLARAGEGEEIIRKTNKKALDRKAMRKARKAAEKRRRLHKRSNKKVTKKVARHGEGEEVVKRVAKKATKKTVKALGLFELSNLLNLNQF